VPACGISIIACTGIGNGKNLTGKNGEIGKDGEIGKEEFNQLHQLHQLDQFYPARPYRKASKRVLK
jgi:hypothetical protein